MQLHPVPLQPLRALPARRPLLVWLLVCVVLLKVATPLLATVSARERAVSLAEVCSVYGVRSIALKEPSDTSKPVPSGHADAGHCVLTSLLGAAVVAAPAVAAVQLHAPAPTRFQALAKSPLPPDAGLAWLAGRTHAPPPLV
jgi:hypothetical protein